MAQKKSTLFTAAGITLGFLSAGFALLHWKLIGYGLSFFVFLPFVLGYVLGQSEMKKVSIWGMSIALAIFILLLLINQLEGMLCVLMALPIVLLAIAAGYGVNYVVKKFRKNNPKPPSELIKVSIVPFGCFALLAFSEHYFIGNPGEIVAITSRTNFPNSPSEVYHAIKSVDTLAAEKLFLMHLGLPVPQKCILEAEAAGGLRTCYFEGGKIVERITALEPGKILKMDVIDYQLTGRKWLGFKEAIYTFEKLPGGGCRMTRITTYSSVLYPRFYWKPLEKWGIENEHQYIFDHLDKFLQ